ncbi:hypothetical protein [Parendozoicomonas sp. Alg238-R29]|uniref:hypothetical protein n=1 Tax=Parendozoicomonas sp. Alg238-R29 TaxID=2993446 RepID=UPI00248D987C|nr:hypothetical protein [Parendozoicomonas sp. Alg238-R29]
MEYNATPGNTGGIRGLNHGGYQSQIHTVQSGQYGGFSVHVNNQPQHQSWPPRAPGFPNTGLYSRHAVLIRTNQPGYIRQAAYVQVFPPQQQQQQQWQPPVYHAPPFPQSSYPQPGYSGYAQQNAWQGFSPQTAPVSSHTRYFSQGGYSQVSRQTAYQPQKKQMQQSSNWQKPAPLRNFQPAHVAPAKPQENVSEQKSISFTLDTSPQVYPKATKFEESSAKNTSLPEKELVSDLKSEKVAVQSERPVAKQEKPKSKRSKFFGRFKKHKPDTPSQLLKTRPQVQENIYEGIGKAVKTPESKITAEVKSEAPAKEPLVREPELKSETTYESLDDVYSKPAPAQKKKRRFGSKLLDRFRTSKPPVVVEQTRPFLPPPLPSRSSPSKPDLPNAGSNSPVKPEHVKKRSESGPPVPPPRYKGKGTKEPVASETTRSSSLSDTPEYSRLFQSVPKPVEQKGTTTNPVYSTLQKDSPTNPTYASLQASPKKQEPVHEGLRKNEPVYTNRGAEDLASHPATQFTTPSPSSPAHANVDKLEDDLESSVSTDSGVGDFSSDLDDESIGPLKNSPEFDRLLAAKKKVVDQYFTTRKKYSKVLSLHIKAVKEAGTELEGANVAKGYEILGNVYNQALGLMKATKVMKQETQKLADSLTDITLAQQVEDTPPDWFMDAQEAIDSERALRKDVGQHLQAIADKHNADNLVLHKGPVLRTGMQLAKTFDKFS